MTDQPKRDDLKGTLKIHDLHEARAAYRQVVETYSLAPEDVHAIMLGATVDVLIQRLYDAYGEPGGGMVVAQDSFEQVRAKVIADVKNGEDKLTDFTVLAFLGLLQTATVAEPKVTR